MAFVLGVGTAGIEVDVGAIDGEAGDDFAEGVFLAFEGEIAGEAVLLGEAVEAAGEHGQFAGKRDAEDQFPCLVEEVFVALVPAGEAFVDALEGLAAAGVDEDAVDEVEEAIAGGAFDGPAGAEAFVAGQDFFGDDVEGAAVVEGGSGDAAFAKGLAAGVLEVVEVAFGVVEAVGVIDAEAVNVAFADEFEEFAVDGVEDGGIFDADGGEFVDVEEAAVVDLVGGDAPEAEAVGLVREDAFEEVEAAGVAALAVGANKDGFDGLLDFLVGFDEGREAAFDDLFFAVPLADAGFAGFGAGGQVGERSENAFEFEDEIAFGVERFAEAAESGFKQTAPGAGSEREGRP